MDGKHQCAIETSIVWGPGEAITVVSTTGAGEDNNNLMITGDIARRRQKAGDGVIIKI